MTELAITRKEICELLKTHISKLVDIIRYQPGLKFPDHCLPARRELTYSKAAVVAWAKANPVDKIKYVNALNNSERVVIQRKTGLEKDMALNFMSGCYDNKTRQLERTVQLIPASLVPKGYRAKVTTQEIGFIPSTNHWDGLI
jgi:hypothetical protein